MFTALFKRIVADDTGATAIEYGLIVSFVVLVMLVSLQALATSTNEMWTRVGTEVLAAIGS